MSAWGKVKFNIPGPITLISTTQIPTFTLSSVSSSCHSPLMET